MKRCTIFQLSILLISLISIQACQNTIRKNPNKPVLSSLPHAIILYFSDSPEELPYFSTFLTHKLKKEAIALAIHDHKINNDWLKIELKQQQEDYKKEIEKMTKSLKELYKKNEVKKCVNSKMIFENRLSKILTNILESMDSKILKDFFFWSTACELKRKEWHKNNALLFYRKYTSLVEMNIYESQINPKESYFIQNLKDFKQKKISIKKPDNCVIFINGFLAKENEIYLPLTSVNAVSANCTKGHFSLIFNSNSTDFIDIENYPSLYSLDKAPLSLPVSIKPFLNGNIVISIYLSKKKKNAEIKIYAENDYSEKENFLIPIKRPDYQNKLANEIIEYLKIKLKSTY